MRIAVTNILWTGSNGTIFAGQSETGTTITVCHQEWFVPVPGEVYEVAGPEREYVDERGGRHPQIDAKVVSRVSTSGALLGPWLRSIPGIGEERSTRLLKQFGPALLDALADPAKSGELAEALAPGRPHLGQKLAALVQARYVSMRVAEATALDEASFYARLEEYGVTDRRAARALYRLLGSTDAWGKLLQHPYAVAAILDWRAADHLGLRLLRARGDVQDPRCHRERLVGACDAAWREILADGSTAANQGDYRARLARFGVNALAAQEVGIDTSRIILSGGVLRAPGAARLERSVVDELARLMASPPVAADWAPLVRCHERSARPLTDEQRRAVVEIFGRAVAVLQGGAGTGKTTTVQTLVDTWLAVGGNVTLAALSGKAALRLSRSTGRLGLTLARLIHGLERRARLASEGRPVPEELPSFDTDTMLVVDESSMVDLATWHRVLRLLPTGARLVMVGDVAQLPPVGLGRVYHDLVEDGHLVSRLFRTMRQAEDNPIITAASLVREGVVPQLPTYVGPARGAYLLECQLSGVEVVIESLREKMSAADGSDDVIVLAALNSTCRRVCRLMQGRREAVVPGRRLGPLAPFVAVGDPVMATRNHYDEALMNGLLGRVECLDPMLIRFDGEDAARAVSDDVLAELVSAWAITGHRAQGSEARRVIVVLDGERLATREWLYTAITRATEQVVLVGTTAALRAAVGRCNIRCTGFPHELAARRRGGGCMSKRVDAVVGAAFEQSKVLLNAVPGDRETYRVNAERIIAVCKELVTAKPSQEPLTPVVAERGAVLYGKFPAGQSLLNRYGAILRVWRGAYRSIVDLSAPVPAKAANGMAMLEEDLVGLDSGAKARMLVVMQMLREQKQENDRLRHLIREQIPAPRQEAAGPLPALLPPKSLSALRTWLNTLASSGGGLELDEVGVRVSRHARPRQVVIPLEVIEALRTLCGGVSQPPS